MIARVDVASPWREHRLLLTALLAMTLIVIVYWQTFSRMMGMWTLVDYQYGWLVYPMALYILWRKRAALASTPAESSWLGVAGTGILVLAWILARAAGVQVIEFASVSLMTMSVFWAVAGTPALKVAGFPLGLLVAAVPTGEFLVVYLQESTTDIASALLHLAGVPAYRENMFLTLPGGSFEVARMCGGLRYLLAASMASLAYAYLTYSALWKRVLFVAAAGIAMVVANGVRAFIVMYVASATEMRVFAGRDHVWFGMILFAAVFALLIYIGDRYADRGSRTAESAGPFLPEGWTSAGPIVAALLFLTVGPGLVYLQARQPSPAVLDMELPPLPECRGPDPWAYDWSPEFQGPDFVRRASYECGRNGAGVYFATYSHQAQGSELISSGNRVWPYEWRRYAEEEVAVTAGATDVRVRQVWLHGPERSVLIWYWYQVGDETLLNGAAVKLATAARALSFRPVEASVIAVAVEGEREVDREQLRKMLEPKALALMTWYRGGPDQESRHGR